MTRLDNSRFIEATRTPRSAPCDRRSLDFRPEDEKPSRTFTPFGDKLTGILIGLAVAGFGVLAVPAVWEWVKEGCCK